MMHRRLTAAGIEVAPHYHQLLVKEKPFNHSVSADIVTAVVSAARLWRRKLLRSRTSYVAFFTHARKFHRAGIQAYPVPSSEVNNLLTKLYHGAD